MKKINFLIFIFFTKIVVAEGYDVFCIGLYDIKFDGSNDDQALDFRYERRYDKSLLEIGPKNYNFFHLKPFIGFETTSDSALYAFTGIYLEDDIGTLFSGESSNYKLTPSFGVGIYDDGSGKKLGNTIEFRTTLELSYQLKNKNRIGFSFGHISNADLGSSNPGVEIINLLYQVAY